MAKYVEYTQEIVGEEKVYVIINKILTEYPPFLNNYFHRKTLPLIGQEILVIMRALAPKRTGKLASSLDFQITPDSVQLGSINPPVIYSRYQDEGYTPHVVPFKYFSGEPANAKGFAKVSKFTPFSRPALMAAQPIMFSEIHYDVKASLVKFMRRVEHETREL